MFEFIGVCAVLICCLKGRWVHGFVLAAGAALVMMWNYQVGVGLFAVTGLMLALPPPVAGSWWDRFRSVDSRGVRLRTREPRPQRILRGAIGACLGVIPGAVGLSMALGSNDDVMVYGVGLVSLAAIPFGAIVGTLIGYHWVPRRALRRTRDSRLSKH